jgi:hypothetical protein
MSALESEGAVNIAKGGPQVDMSRHVLEASINNFRYTHKLKNDTFTKTIEREPLKINNIIRAEYLGTPVMITVKEYTFNKVNAKVLVVAYDGIMEHPEFYSPMGMPYAIATCVNNDTYSALCLPYQRENEGRIGFDDNIQRLMDMAVHTPTMQVWERGKLLEYGKSKLGVIQGVLDDLQIDNFHKFETYHRSASIVQMSLAAKLTDLAIRIQEDIIES